MDGLIDYFGINKRMCVGNLGKKEKGTRLKWHKRAKIVKELNVLQKGYMKQGVKMLVKHIADKRGGIRALEMRPSKRLKVRRNIAHVMGKKAGVSLSRDLETQEMECQNEMAVSAARFQAHACWPGRRNEDMIRVWRRQVFETTRWSQVRGPAGVVFRGLSDVGVMWSQWDTFVIDGVSICCRSIHPDAVSKHMSRHMRKLCWKSWAREHNVDELNDNSWFQPVETIIKNTCTTIWTKKRVDMAMSWVAKWCSHANKNMWLRMGYR